MKCENIQFLRSLPLLFLINWMVMMIQTRKKIEHVYSRMLFLKHTQKNMIEIDMAELLYVFDRGIVSGKAATETRELTHMVLNLTISPVSVC